MGFFNRVILLGNVTRNPEVRYIPGSGTAVARFGLAVNRRYKAGNETKEEVCYIDIVAFSKLGEFCGEFLTKGVSVLVEGRLSFRTWEQDGVKKSKHEIIAENIQLVWKKDKSDVNDMMAESFDSTGIEEEDLPF
ncbi:MAG: single-stranded DNA-binding protein [Calditerrivibrio sp.]|nr:single-stranded DNA-binding protein [Calditerrivibrio sp.]MCA1932602.1 single-stranded DNA-binding protein [Calditerrivibrio sp.]MCA1980311.1 single-stranded DNA-binding protein [Calditerrivibrio sp.]